LDAGWIYHGGLIQKTFASVILQPVRSGVNDLDLAEFTLASVYCRLTLQTELGTNFSERIGMPQIQHAPLRDLSQTLYEAVGVPADQAKVVTDHLVDANLFGHDSHGSIRTPGYLKSIKAGKIKPVGDLNIIRASSTTAVIDAEHTLGIVVAHKAMQMAVDKAKEHSLGAVAVNQSSHIGRLGDYPPVATEQGCIGLLILNGGGALYRSFWGYGKTPPAKSDRR
jgi:hypothetical protein